MRDKLEMAEIKTDGHRYYVADPRLPGGEFVHECDRNDCHLEEELRQALGRAQQGG